MLEAIELLLVGALPLLSALWTLRAMGPRPERERGPRVEAPAADVVDEDASLRGGRAIRRVGPYALVAKIAAGAMGEVYRARDTRSGHLRAVKLLPRGASAGQRQQFEREALAGARLSHPNVVTVYERGSAADGTRWLAMELLDGVSLEELVEHQGPQPPERVIEILRQTAAALAELHDHGLVHRDIKPQNILLCRAPGGGHVAKLIDFGLVKDSAEGTGAPGSIVGTPLYISPEALTLPDEVDGRSDLYSLGAVAHFLLTGAPVFNGRSVVEVCGQHLFSAPEPPSEVLGWRIDDDLERLVLDCLAKEPSARPASARELMRRLEGCAPVERGARSRLRSQPLAIAC